MAEKRELLRNANIKLKIGDDMADERNRHIVFIYCPLKVGSTSLVSSFRICTLAYVKVIHIHNEECLKILYGIENVTINEIIQYNHSLNKIVTVIDIYRNPIEQKMSIFFELLESYHFNNTEDKIVNYPIDKLIHRFNRIFPYLCKDDYYKEKYNISYPSTFDTVKKYICTVVDGIKYVKLRLEDSHNWQQIIRESCGYNVKIVNDYETESKNLSDLYKRFKNEYRIPKNFLEAIESKLHYYLSPEEKTTYIRNWSTKQREHFEGFTEHEYRIYNEITLENAYIQIIQKSHYKDGGCICVGCASKRKKLYNKLMKGEDVKNEHIHHNESVEEYKHIFKEKVKNRINVCTKKRNHNIGMKL